MKATDNETTKRNYRYYTMPQPNTHTRALKYVLTYILLLGIILLSVGVSSASVEFKNNTYILTVEINDTVFTENEHIYIESKPHTIYQDGYVFFNFTFKNYVGNVDIYLGFTDSSYPVNISILDGKEYIQVRNNIEKQRHKLDDKEYWHYITNIRTVKNNSVRVWIDIKEGVENGKYDFAVMKTGMELTESVVNKNLFILDPYYESWYNSDCPNGGINPCNKIAFIDIGNKKFIYLQIKYLCGDVTGDNEIDTGDTTCLRNYLLYSVTYPQWFSLYCNPPSINYEILDYSRYVGTNIIRPNKSDEYD